MADQKKIYNILLIEDNLGDIRLTQEAFKEGQVPVNLNVFTNGEDALTFLLNVDSLSEQFPDIILMDLNLPRKDGRTVLTELKRNNSLKRIPVIVLTTSNSAKDILNSYDLHVNCFINKPIDFDDFIKVVNNIKTFWFETAVLPSMVE